MMADSRRHQKGTHEPRAPYKAPHKEAMSQSGQPDWEWIRENREQLAERYAGCWVAVSGGQVVGAGVRLATALKQARAHGIDHPFVTTIRPVKRQGTAEVAHWL